MYSVMTICILRYVGRSGYYTMTKNTSVVDSGMKKIAYVGGVLVLIVMGILAHLVFGSRQNSDQGMLAGATMGTSYHIKYWYQDLHNGPEKTVIESEISSILRNITNEVSTWNKKSTISKFNNTRNTEWVPVKPFFAHMVAQAVDICEKTQGAFDITIAPVIDLWGFDAKGRINQRPEAPHLAKALGNTGCHQVESDVKKSRIRKLKKGVQINLSAIAKGDGVDQIAYMLKEYGIANFLVEIGGEVVASGTRADGTVWKIGIERPDNDTQGVQSVLSLYNQGMATSGDYRNYTELNGVRYSHIINPQTGTPILHQLASISVLAPTTGEADAWATGLFVLGEGRGLQVANQHRLPILMIVRTDDMEHPYRIITNTAWDMYVATHGHK